MSPETSKPDGRLAALLKIRKRVGPTVVVVIETVGSSLLVTLKVERGRIPAHGTTQFAGDVEDTAERVGAASVFHGSPSIVRKGLLLPAM